MKRLMPMVGVADQYKIVTETMLLKHFLNSRNGISVQLFLPL